MGRFREHIFKQGIALYVKTFFVSFENLSPDIFTTFNILICVYIYIYVVISSLETTIKGQKEITMSYPVPEVCPWGQREEGVLSAEKHTSWYRNPKQYTTHILWFFVLTDYQKNLVNNLGIDRYTVYNTSLNELSQTALAFAHPLT